MKIHTILGSQSPRRKELLSQVVPKFNITVPNIEEQHMEGESPLVFSERIAMEKGESILRNNTFQNYPMLLITTDTIVTIDNIILGKPDSFQEAVESISLLKGRTHQVISSISLFYMKSDKELQTITETEITEVRFKELTRNEIYNYLQSIQYSDKAGAYAIQEKGHLIVEDFNGSFTNVIGLPFRLLFKMLHGLSILENV